MAVNGNKHIRKGQRWTTRGGSQAKVIGHRPGYTYPWEIDVDGHPHAVTDEGFFYEQFSAGEHELDLIELIDETNASPGPIHPPQEREELTFHEMPGCAPPIGVSSEFATAFATLAAVSIAAGDVVAPPGCIELASSHAADGGIGDIHSDAKGTGARYNAGKPPYELVPLRQLGTSFLHDGGLTDDGRAAARVLQFLGDYQSRARGIDALYDAMAALGLEGGWEDCARVFDYGKRKYAAWNWAKGMAWSVPIACAARHCLDIIAGTLIDLDKPGAPGSGLPHRGHIFCNLVMLIAYATTYQEGDDRPAPGLLAANDFTLRSVA